MKQIYLIITRTLPVALHHNLKLQSEEPLRTNCPLVDGNPAFLPTKFVTGKSYNQ